MQHAINTRLLTTHEAIKEELALDPKKNYLFDLSYLGLLTVEGDKALDFLQGQLTCDVREVSTQRMQPGALCCLKGRIVALMDVLQWQGVQLVLPQDVLESTLRSLAKAALLSRVRLQNLDAFAVLGFYLQNTDDLVPMEQHLPTAVYDAVATQAHCVYHVGGGFYILLVSKDLQQAMCAKFIAANQYLGSLTWHTLRLKQQALNIYPESKGLFLPHRLGLHKTPYVSFNKGCYKGQEIIARMHYRATLKHHLALYTVHTQAAIFSGQKLLTGLGGTEVGEVVDYSLLGDGVYLVAVSILQHAPQHVLLQGQEAMVYLSGINDSGTSDPIAR